MIVESSSTAPEFNFPRSWSEARLIVLKPNLGYPKRHPIVVRAEFLARVVEGLLGHALAARVVILEGVCCKESFPVVMQKAGVAGWFEWDRFESTGRTIAPALPWGGQVELWDADRAPLAEYRHPGVPHRFATLKAPAVLQEADACISLAPLKRTVLKDEPLYSATIKNLFGLIPRTHYHARSPHSRGQLHRPDVQHVVEDVYHTLGPFFHYGIVDLHEYFISRDWQPDAGKAHPVGRCVAGQNLIHVDATALALAGESPGRYLKALLDAGAPTP
ncbi:MAG: DUF362 domain-containing protein [Candidatus Sumerlaeia bacterium]|nr:DUF362 domain-containing protein [Candidatus Sumerlaeia bacterium]